MWDLSGSVFMTSGHRSNELIFSFFYSVLLYFYATIPLTPITPRGSMVGVRGMPERDIESLGVMGKGAGGGQEILPPPPPSPSSPPPIKSENPKSSYFFQEIAHISWPYRQKCGKTNRKITI